MKRSRLEEAARKVILEWVTSPLPRTQKVDREALLELFIRFAQAERRKAFREAAELLREKVRHDHTSGECPYCEMPRVYSKQIMDLAKLEGKK